MSQVASEGTGVPVQAPAEGQIVTPKFITYATRGIRNTRDVGNLMSALIHDLAVGAVTPQIANSAVNATGKMLKAAELQVRYGRKIGENGQKCLELADASG